MTDDTRTRLDGFDSLIREAGRLPFRGWDFGPLGSRWQRGKPDWDLSAILRERLRNASTFLDLGTGGGEFLSSLQPLPPHTVATEGYEPNVPVARARLEPLGVRVLPVPAVARIDLPTGSVDVVHSRHEAFDANEVARLLRTGGTLITQQLGGRNYEDLHRRFQVSPEPAFNRLDTLGQFVEEISDAGLRVETARECVYPERFLDVGAVVYYLEAAPWEVPGFSPERYRGTLEAIHADIRRRGFWELRAHRLLVVATK